MFLQAPPLVATIILIFFLELVQKQSSLFHDRLQSVTDVCDLIFHLGNQRLTLLVVLLTSLSLELIPQSVAKCLLLREDAAFTMVQGSHQPGDGFGARYARQD